MSEFQESLGTLDEPVLTQLLRDTKSLTMLQLPLAIIKYENEVSVDTVTGAIRYILKIWYEATYQQMKYKYERLNTDEATGTWKVKEGDYLDNPATPKQSKAFSSHYELNAQKENPEK